VERAVLAEEEDFVLAGEVMVEVGDGEVGPFRDVAHRRVGEAALAEDAPCRPENRHPRRIAAALHPRRRRSAAGPGRRHIGTTILLLEWWFHNWRRLTEFQRRRGGEYGGNGTTFTTEERANGDQRRSHAH